MKKSLLLVIFLLCFICFSIPVKAEEYTLSWDANSESDLAGYKIYVGTESRKYNDVIIPTGEQALATVFEGVLTIPEDTKITYYFAVTAYDTSGLESDFSNEVFKEYDTRVAPAAPKNLKWYEKIIAWLNKHLVFWS